MVTSSAATVEEYLAQLPEGRRPEIQAVRDLVNRNLPEGYEERMQYGMISWVVPEQVFPDTYNGKPLAIASLGAQKRYNSLYLMGVYGDPKVEKWFTEAYAASGKRLDMGKSCVRFRTAADLPLDVVAEAVARVAPERFMQIHEAAHGTKRSR